MRKWQDFPKFPIFRTPDFKQTSVLTISSTRPVRDLKSKYLSLQWNNYLSTTSKDDCKILIKRIEALLDYGMKNIQVVRILTPRLGQEPKKNACYFSSPD